MYRKTQTMTNAEVTSREAWSMSPRLRKLALMAHVAFSVGWLGAVALRTQLVVDASLAIAVLLVTTTLSIYKPWGLSAYGRRRQASATVSTGNNPQTSNVKTALIVALVLATIVTVHILKGGLHHH